MKILSLLTFMFALAFGSADVSSSAEHIDLSTTWVGILCFIVFLVGYYFIAAEEKYHINKAKPAMFIGTLMFMLTGIYMVINGIPTTSLNNEVNHLILEIAQIVFFLTVAMTYIEALIDRDVFNTLKYNLVSKGYSYKKLFWLTGVIAFFLSPIADNLTTALILSTVLLTIDRTNKPFLVAGAINIVVAANAGGAWSPFGDITTLMVWAAGKSPFIDFLALFPTSIIGWLLTAYLLSLSVPDGKPNFDAENEPKFFIKKGGKVIIYLGIFTIICAVLGHQLFHLPAMFGMMFGMSLLGVYTYIFKRTHKTEEPINLFHFMSKIENDTLMFFFGILSAVGALHFLGFLDYLIRLYDIFGFTSVNIAIGFVSAIVDNVPVMSAVLKSNPSMGIDEWLLVTLTAGIGGSMISFGSAAGVGVMGKLKGIYTFGAHMSQAWKVVAGYIISLLVWYIQFEILGWY
ncbi:sodium:proton antiporter NhaD [Campylobacter sp. faydin G-140]|uniref:sodium:proton antiporter NhaD n=1 Tax=Campylobacter anatolicus TaxID=2829105 RepID=UPI001B986E39|nr:sodium:proton antiporter NhaD [Campylobacter anatolicus]MBR8462447.1 sodium:proton antiporter NhaD [Campylobacter anatolicus]MBR8465575.1 sodium:proton antiporter NhaD [Campylobacter anatolicus]